MNCVRTISIIHFDTIENMLLSWGPFPAYAIFHHALPSQRTPAMPQICVTTGFRFASAFWVLFVTSTIIVCHAMPPPYQIIVDDPEIEKSETDNRSFRLLRLAQNDLSVLVISDPSADRAAASLDVNVGSFADHQYELPGLAHFCEHLLFMGTEKYPDEREYRTFLSKHLGIANAYTDSEHTNYHFEVDTTHLEGALDRFAQFFISPMFSKSCQDREIRAVDSENKKNLQNDRWRARQLDKLTANERHPYNGFSTGNLESLSEGPASRGVNPRDVLLKFYLENYSANLMNLVILGKENVEELTQMALDKFNAIPNHNIEKKSYKHIPIYTEEQLLTLMRIKPTKDTNELSIAFYIPGGYDAWWKTKPGRYFLHLMGHEGKGSLCYYLKCKNWITSLVAGPRILSEGNAVFYVNHELTPEGLENWEKILVHTFEYLKLITEEPKKWVWDELSLMSKLNFRYGLKGRPFDVVTQISSGLWQFTGQNKFLPPKRLMSSGVMDDFDSDSIKKFASFLTPKNLRVKLSAKLLDNLPLREKWYGSEYSFEPISSYLLEKIDSAISNMDMYWIHPNELMPKNFDVLAEKAELPKTSPYLIADDLKFETWFKQDDIFMVPKGRIRLNLYFPELSHTVKEYECALIFSDMVAHELNDFQYYASLVGFTSSVESVKGELEIRVTGYSDKLAQYLEDLLIELIAYRPKQERFEVSKYILTQERTNLELEDAYIQAELAFRQTFGEHSYSCGDRVEALKEIQFEDIIEFVENKMWSSGVFVQLLILGNFDYQGAKEVQESLERVFAKVPKFLETKDDVHKATRLRSRKLEGSEVALRDIELKDAHNVNSCLDYYVEIGEREPSNHKLDVLTTLLVAIMAEPSFDQLRTKEQLGYIVQSLVRTTQLGFGFRIIVQSERTCDYLQFRVEEFIRTLGKTIHDLTDATFERFKAAVRSKKLTKVKTPQEEAQIFWYWISTGFLDFDKKLRDVEVLDLLTRNDLVKFFDNYVSMSNEKAAPRVATCIKSQAAPVLDGTRALEMAVHNFMFEQDISIPTNEIDEILASEKHIAAISKKIIDKAGIQDAVGFEKQFVAQVTERTEKPVPEGYPRGEVYKTTSDFREAHKFGQPPTPAKKMASFLYPHTEAHL